MLAWIVVEVRTKDSPLGLERVLLGLDSPGGLAFFGCGLGHCLWYQ
jgi:hypothetical protein